MNHGIASLGTVSALKLDTDGKRSHRPAVHFETISGVVAKTE
jgi:hypothetical protein